MNDGVLKRPVPGTQAKAEKTFPWALMALLSALASTFVILDRLDGSVRLADVDDRLRALQVGQLWATGRWYDLTLSMIRMPELYISPWSRLVDAPYITIAWLLSFWLPSNTALQWSFLIWPPTMLLAYCGLFFSIIHRFPAVLRGSPAMVAVGTFVFMIPMLGEFTPGRIDHHNVQIVLVMLMLAGIMRWTTWGGLATGTGAALSVAVGMETVPIIVVLLGAITVAWVAGAAGARRVVVSTMLATAIATLAAGTVLIGPHAMASTQCDSFSAPHIYALVSLSLATALAAAVSGTTTSGVWKLGFALTSCVAVCASFAAFFPACLAGPYAIIDPVSRHFWLDRIPQEGSALEMVRVGETASILFLTIQTAIVLFTLPAIVALARRGRVQEAIVYVAVVTALLLTFGLLRYVNFVSALLPLLLPLVFDRIASPAPQRLSLGFFAALAAIVAPVVVAAVVLWVTPVRTTSPDIFNLMGDDDCANDDYGDLSRLPPGLIMAPMGLSISIAMQALPGLSVAAIPFHRSSPGLRRLYLAFTTSDPSVRRAALAPFDYIAVCRLAAATDRAQAPLYAALASGDAWPGLMPVDTDSRSRLRLLRIDHALLR